MTSRVILTVPVILFSMACGTRTANNSSTSQQSAPASSAAANAGIPSWVPIYPGTAPQEVKSTPSDYESRIDFFLIPQGKACPEFLDFYERALNENGFQIPSRLDSVSGDGSCASILEGDWPLHERSVNVRATNDAGGGSHIYIEVIQRNSHNPAPSTTSLPDWAPIYAGTTPQFIAGRKNAYELDLGYSFTSRDDPQKVLTWFSDKLTPLGFRMTSDFHAIHGGYIDSSTADGNRMFNIVAARAGVAPVFHVTLRDTFRATP